MRVRSVRSAATPSAEANPLIFRKVTPARWKDLVRLFERRGGPRYCWCMEWRVTPKEFRSADRGRLKAGLAQRVHQRVPIGILGYLNDEPIAWCSIAPRSTYRSALTADPPAGDETGKVWSLVCFFVSRPHRGQRTMRRLLEAAIEHARKRGATVVEAYPVDPDSPSYRFMGFVSSFKAAGFREVGRAGTRRHVVRLHL
jgi:GNAT superfamily N-acetyltransferase